MQIKVFHAAQKCFAEKLLYRIFLPPSSPPPRTSMADALMFLSVRTEVQVLSWKLPHSPASVNTGHKKSCRKRQPFLHFVSHCTEILFRVYCRRRTSVGASSTVGTFIRVDFVYVARRNCSYGTFVNASPACSAVITNFICHNCAMV